MKYKWKTRPYHHQVAAVKKLLSTGWGGALLMEPRTGKTKVCIDYASILHQAGKVNRVLVLMPVSVIGVWEDEIAAHCPFKYRITVWDKKGRKKKALPRNGSNVLDFVLINYDAFSSPGRWRQYRKRDGSQGRKRVGGRIAIRNSVRDWNPQLVVLDESHRIKNPSARKTSMIHTLGEVAEYRVIATGTAVTKKRRIFDLYSQWMFLNPQNEMLWDPITKEQYTLKDFKRRWGVFITQGGYERWIRNRPLRQLHEYIHRDAYAITRDECFDLPKKREQKVWVQLEESKHHYLEMAEEMITRLESGEVVEAPIKLVQALRLTQLTSGIAKTTPTADHPEAKLHRIGREKYNMAYDLLSDWFEADEKVVVAAVFIADIQAVIEICNKLRVPVFELSGRVKSRVKRHENIRKFREMDGPACFVAQPQAGSLGIDLSTASIMLWYSLTRSYVDFTQMNDRIALSPRKIMIHYLLAKGTIDEVLLQALKEDGDVARVMTASPRRLADLERMGELLD